MRIELLWFDDCPNHEAAESMLHEVMLELGLDEPIERLQVEDEALGRQVCFPGSPTIRINGADIEPEWEPCEDCTPRCRLYLTQYGLRGLPDRQWIADALTAAAAAGG